MRKFLSRPMCKVSAACLTWLLACSPHTVFSLAAPTLLQPSASGKALSNFADVLTPQVVERIANEQAPFISADVKHDDNLRLARLATSSVAAGEVHLGLRGAALGLDAKKPEDKATISALKDMMDTAAMMIVKQTYIDSKVQAIPHAAEGAADGVTGSFMPGVVVNPEGKRTIHFHSDVVEGTDNTIKNNDGRTRQEISSQDSGGMSTLVVGDALEHWGFLPDFYAGQFFTHVPKEHEARIQEMIESPEFLAAEDLETLERVLTEVAQANDLRVNDLEVVIMDRDREGARLQVLEAIEKKCPGFKITKIKSGTMAHGLLASLGQALSKGSKKHKVFLGVGGTPEALMNVAIASSIPGAVGAMVLYSNGMNPDVKKEEGRNLSKRYAFSDEEKALIGQLRADKGDAEAIIAGKHVFSAAPQKGQDKRNVDIAGSFAFITDNGVFDQPGALEIAPGVYQVRTLVIRGGNAQVVVDNISAEKLQPVLYPSFAENVPKLLKRIEKSIKVTAEGVVIEDKNKATFREVTLPYLVREAGLSPKADVRVSARRILREAGLALGVQEASIEDLDKAKKSGDNEWTKRVPVIHTGIGAYDTLCSIFAEAKQKEVGTLILDVAKSEEEEYVAMAYAAAIAKGYKGFIFIQKDDFSSLQTELPALDSKDVGKTPGKEKSQEIILGIIGKEMVSSQHMASLTDEMYNYCRALMYPNMHVDEKTKARLQKAGLDSQQARQVYADKFCETWQRAFAEIARKHRNVSTANEFALILADADDLGPYKGSLKDLTKELSGPFKAEIAALPASVKAKMDKALRTEFRRIFDVQKAGGTKDLVEKNLAFTAHKVVLPQRPEALRLAISA